MGLFGKKPKLRKRSAGFNQLAGQMVGLAAEQKRFDLGTQAGLRDLAGGRTSDRRAIRQAVAADAQFAQKGQAKTSSDITENAIRRAKGLSSVVNATNTEFDQQILQERIGSTGEAMQRRGVGLRQLAQAGNLEDAFNAQKEVTANVKDELKGDIFGAAVGTAAGAAAGGFADLFKKPKFDGLGFDAQVGGSLIPERRTL
jgi:hypothetical protein